MGLKWVCEIDRPRSPLQWYTRTNSRFTWWWWLVGVICKVAEPSVEVVVIVDRVFVMIIIVVGELYTEAIFIVVNLVCVMIWRFGQ